MEVCSVVIKNEGVVGSTVFVGCNEAGIICKGKYSGKTVCDAAEDTFIAECVRINPALKELASSYLTGEENELLDVLEDGHYEFGDTTVCITWPDVVS